MPGCQIFFSPADGFALVDHGSACKVATITGHTDANLGLAGQRRADADRLQVGLLDHVGCSRTDEMKEQISSALGQAELVRIEMDRFKEEIGKTVDQTNVRLTELEKLFQIRLSDPRERERRRGRSGRCVRCHVRYTAYSAAIPDCSEHSCTSLHRQDPRRPGMQ